MATKTATNTKPQQESRRVNELSEKLWAVVSFERIEAGGLTYDEAVQKMKALVASGSSGLCIVTDEAASRVNR